jgi:hypothetical protein
MGSQVGREDCWNNVMKGCDELGHHRLGNRKRFCNSSVLSEHQL